MAKYRKPYSLFKRGKYYYYQTYNEEGRRMCPKTTGQTKKILAIEYCDSLLHDNRLISNRISLQEYSKGFYDDDGKYLSAKIKKLAPSTVRHMRSRYNNYIIPDLGKLQLGDINFYVVSKYRKDLVDRGLSASTIKHIIQALKVVHQTAVHENLATPITWDEFESLEAKKKARDGFTYNEVKNIFKTLPEDLRPFYMILTLTGVRFSEAFGITVDDIKYKDGNLYIHLSKQYLKGEYQELKNKKPRDLPICNELIKYIQPYNFSTAYIYAGGNVSIRQCEAWKERNLCNHSFRHFFITETKNAGINIQKVEQYAGHSLKGIQEVYTTYHLEDFTDLVSWQKKILKDLELIIKENPTELHYTKKK